MPLVNEHAAENCSRFIHALFRLFRASSRSFVPTSEELSYGTYSTLEKSVHSQAQFLSSETMKSY